MFEIGRKVKCQVTGEYGLSDDFVKINGKYYKRLVVVNADKPFFKVGKTVYYNLQKISNSILKSREPVSFSFG